MQCCGCLWLSKGVSSVSLAVSCPTLICLAVFLTNAGGSDTALTGSAVEQLLTGIVGGMLTRRQHRSAQDVAFYCTLLNLGGPMVFKFVSGNLHGPSLTMIRRHRMKASQFRLDNPDGNVKQVGSLMHQLRALSRAIIVSEDHLPIQACPVDGLGCQRAGVQRSDWATQLSPPGRVFLRR